MSQQSGFKRKQSRRGLMNHSHSQNNLGPYRAPVLNQFENPLSQSIQNGIYLNSRQGGPNLQNLATGNTTIGIGHGVNAIGNHSMLKDCAYTPQKQSLQPNSKNQPVGSLTGRKQSQKKQGKFAFRNMSLTPVRNNAVGQQQIADEILDKRKFSQNVGAKKKFSEEWSRSGSRSRKEESVSTNLAMSNAVASNGMMDKNFARKATKNLDSDIIAILRNENKRLQKQATDAQNFHKNEIEVLKHENENISGMLEQVMPIVQMLQSQDIQSEKADMMNMQSILTVSTNAGGGINPAAAMTTQGGGQRSNIQSNQMANSQKHELFQSIAQMVKSVQQPQIDHESLVTSLLEKVSSRNKILIKAKSQLQQLKRQNEHSKSKLRQSKHKSVRLTKKLQLLANRVDELESFKATGIEFWMNHCKDQEELVAILRTHEQLIQDEKDDQRTDREERGNLDSNPVIIRTTPKARTNDPKYSSHGLLQAMNIGDGVTSKEILDSYIPLPSFLKAFTTSEIILIDELEETLKNNDSMEVLDALELSIEGTVSIDNSREEDFQTDFGNNDNPFQEQQNLQEDFKWLDVSEEDQTYDDLATKYAKEDNNNQTEPQFPQIPSLQNSKQIEHVTPGKKMNKLKKQLQTMQQEKQGAGGPRITVPVSGSKTDRNYLQDAFQPSSLQRENNSSQKKKQTHGSNRKKSLQISKLGISRDSIANPGFQKGIAETSRNGEYLAGLGIAQAPMTKSFANLNQGLGRQSSVANLNGTLPIGLGGDANNHVGQSIANRNKQSRNQGAPQLSSLGKSPGRTRSQYL